jgi:hypothetical protein
MCEVYKNATCNLAALAASNGESGLFNRQNREDGFPVRVRLDNLSSSDVQYAHFQPTKYWELLGKGPLTERAWVFQEQLLVRRGLVVLKNSGAKFAESC